MTCTTRRRPTFGVAAPAVLGAACADATAPAASCTTPLPHGRPTCQ